MKWTTSSCELKALNAMNNLGLWMIWTILGHELKAIDVVYNSGLWIDSTHGSLALKAYQQNLYLRYYY